MAGVKGRSGRKSLKYEVDTANILKMANKTLKDLFAASSRGELTIDQQLKLALPIVQKAMPDKIEFEDLTALSYEERGNLMDKLVSALGIVAKGREGEREGEERESSLKHIHAEIQTNNNDHPSYPEG